MTGVKQAHSRNDNSIDNYHKGQNANQRDANHIFVAFKYQHVTIEHKVVADKQEEKFVEIFQIYHQWGSIVRHLIDKDEVEDACEAENLHLNPRIGNHDIRECNKEWTARQEWKTGPFNLSLESIQAQI